MKMNKFIAISSCILLIVFYESNGSLDDGFYSLNGVQTYYVGTTEVNKTIVVSQKPYLNKIDDNYWITYKADDEKFSDKQIVFKVIQIMIMIETLVDVKIMENGSSITLLFPTLQMAQNLCTHYEFDVDLGKRMQSNLLAVFRMDENYEPSEAAMSNGAIWIDPWPRLTDDFEYYQFTIFQSDDYLPRFRFDSKDFNVSEIKDESCMLISISTNDNEYDYLLKFATPDDATSFHELVTLGKHVNPSIALVENLESP